MEDDRGALFFVPVAPPSHAELAAVTATIVRRVRRLLVRRGVMTEDGEPEPFVDPDDLPALAGAYACGVQGRGLFKFSTADAPEWDDGRALKARVSGFDLHAAVAVSNRNRPRLEKLCRYILRPPLSDERIQPAGEGRVLLRLKSQWRDGTTHVSLSGEDFMERLATLIPRPQANTVLYHGVLAANAKWRRRVVPARTGPSRAVVAQPTPARSNASWAELMKHSFGLDVLACPQCAGRLDLIAVVMERSAVRAILDHLGFTVEPLPLGRPPPPPDDSFWAA